MSRLQKSSKIKDRSSNRAGPWQKSTKVNCSKTIVLEVILQFTIVNYSNTTIYYSITIVLQDSFTRYYSNNSIYT